METPIEAHGDLADILVAELKKRGIDLPENTASRLPARWRVVKVGMNGRTHDLGFAARGCSVPDVIGFCYALLHPFRTTRPHANDNDDTFWFQTAASVGVYQKTPTGLVVSFLSPRLTLTIGQANEELHIGFAPN